MEKIAVAMAVSAGLLFSSGSALAEDAVVAQSKTKWPECYCTDTYGKRRELGDIICLTVGGRSYEAKCIMAQNNPFWRDLERGCLSSSLPKNQTPFPTDVASELASLF